jgi:pimeloyl-ACP methyl ester carboxylesterase
MADLQGIDLVPRLGSLAVPTLAIGTDRDLLVDPDQTEKVPATSRVRIYGCGHIPMVEKPAEFNEALHNWLAASPH